MEWKWSLHWGSIPQVMCGSAIIHRWLWITQAEPCYLCTLERHVHTEIPTIRKGNTWVHLRSPRWAMLSWYFTWKDRIGDCLWTWVNICVCCQNKNRRAHKQNKGYMGAMPRGLNKEGGDVHVQSCTHTDTTPPFCTPLSPGGDPVLPYLQKSVKDKEPSLNSGTSWLAEKSFHEGMEGCVLTTEMKQPGLCPHQLVLDCTTSGLSGKDPYGAAKAEPGSEPMASSVGSQDTRVALSLLAPVDALIKPRAAFPSLGSISCFLFLLSKLQI